MTGQFRVGKYKKRITAQGVSTVSTPQTVQQVEKKEQKKDEAAVAADRKRLFQQWRKF
jgi:hypothetical protein